MSGFAWESGATLVTPGPDISFMAAAGDNFYVDPNESSWTVDVRLETQDAARQHGVVAFPPLLGAGHLRISGLLKPATDTAAARDSMAQTLEAAALALTGGTLGTFTCSRGSVGVTLEMWPVITGGFRKTYVIVLLAPNPTWA